MRIRLFRPVTTELLIKRYALGLAKLGESEGDSANLEFGTEMKQLTLALINREVDVTTIPPAPLSEEEEIQLDAAMRECYRDAAPSMTSADLDAYRIRLILNDFDDFAKPIEQEMEKRGLGFSSRKAIKTAQEDLAEAADALEQLRQILHDNGKVAEYIAARKAEAAARPKNAWARPDSEHDPALHRNLKPQIRAYNQHWHYD